MNLAALTEKATTANEAVEALKKRLALLAVLICAIQDKFAELMTSAIPYRLKYP